MADDIYLVQNMLPVSPYTSLFWDYYNWTQDGYNICYGPYNDYQQTTTGRAWLAGNNKAYFSKTKITNQNGTYGILKVKMDFPAVDGYVQAPNYTFILGISSTKPISGVSQTYAIPADSIYITPTIEEASQGVELNIENLSPDGGYLCIYQNTADSQPQIATNFIDIYYTGYMECESWVTSPTIGETITGDISSGKKAYAKDINDLRTAVYYEFNRRNNPYHDDDESSTLKPLAPDEFNSTVSTNSPITIDEANKTLNKMLIINDFYDVVNQQQNEIILKNGSSVNLLDEIKRLGQIEKTSYQHGCMGACTGLCYGTCYNGCGNGCSGTSKEITCSSCEGACADNCGSDCTTGCNGTSYGVECGGCSSSCGGSGCGSTCHAYCGGTNTWACTGCTSQCGAKCSAGCQGNCADGCQGGCKGGCVGACAYGCQSGCGASCQSTEKAVTVITTCDSGCAAGCYTGCTGHCSNLCTGVAN